MKTSNYSVLVYVAYLLALHHGNHVSLFIATKSNSIGLLIIPAFNLLPHATLHGSGKIIVLSICTYVCLIRRIEKILLLISIRASVRISHAYDTREVSYGIFSAITISVSIQQAVCKKKK